MEVSCILCNKSFKRYCDLSKHLNLFHNISPREYYDLYLKKEGDGVCSYCKNSTKFLGLQKGYQKYCSLKCGGKGSAEKSKETFLKNHGSYKNRDNSQQWRKDPNKLEQWNSKRKNTCLAKYGSENFFSSEIGKKRIKDTFKEKYGVDNPSQCSIIREKVRQTNLQHFGVECNFASRKIREKIKNTLLSKYGVSHNWSVKELRKKASDKLELEIQEYCKQNNYSLLNDVFLKYGTGWYQCGEFDSSMISYKNRVLVSNYALERIKEYSSTITSKLEEEVFDFITSLGEEVVRSSRKVIAPYELDFYFSKKNIAIEVNGNYWHTNRLVDKNYHLNKTLLCEENGIRLIHIFEHEWSYKKEICKSIICCALGKSKRIYARDCKIDNVSRELAIDFLKDNHLQGSIESQYRLGLFYKKELVQLICIGKSRFKKGEYELLRMCTKKDTLVIGGFSKLVKHQPFTPLISYVDRAKFTGEGYLNSGFKVVSNTPPSYVYVKNKDLLSRYQTQKHKLSSLANFTFDTNKTEEENMNANGWYRLYDCGNMKMVKE